jgi:DNA polymerase sigma
MILGIFKKKIEFSASLVNVNGNNYSKKTLTDAEIKQMVVESGELIKRSNKFNVVEALPQARYPICIIEHVRTNLPLDISFGDGLGVRNNQIINYWLDLQDPNARKLALFIRRWFDMSSYKEENFHKTVDMLVIFFLQQKKLLPSYAEIQKRAPYAVDISGTDTRFNENLKKAEDYGLKKMADYKQYISEFFAFYRDFDFAHNVVCPLTGEPVPRNKKHEEMEKYWNDHQYMQK